MANHVVLWTSGTAIRIPTQSADAGPYPRINNLGEVVGTIFYDDGAKSTAFSWSGGTVRDVLTASSEGTATGISDNGTIIGCRGLKLSGAFIMRGTHTFQLARLDNNESEVFGINQRDTVVGAVHYGPEPAMLFSPGGWVAACWTGNKLRLLDVVGSKSAAYAINGHNDVVGSRAGQAALWRSGKRRVLPGLVGVDAAARSINDAEQIVGYSAVKRHTGQLWEKWHHAVLWEHGDTIDLNETVPKGSGWLLSTAESINKQGQIAGTGILHGKSCAFLLVPRNA